MSFFDEIFQKLFSSADDPALKNSPYIQESLVRNEKYLSQYDKWKTSNSARELKSFAWEQFIMGKENLGNPSIFRLLSESTSNGFMLRCQEGENPLAFSFFLDNIRDHLGELGYKIYLSDRRIYNRNSDIESIERHYMKPSIKLPVEIVDGRRKQNQLFGNIHVELFSYNNSQSHIKFMVNSYNDFKFLPAQSFDTLVELLLKPQR